MAILQLDIQNFRNLKHVLIEPTPRLNYIFGPNGSGKTSLLEAIHCLGRGKSFRTHKTSKLVGEDKPCFTLVGQVDQKGRKFTIGIHRQSGTSTIRVNSQNISRLSELTEVLPIAVLDPGLHRLVDEGPEYRRRFLDWGVFHVEHGFTPIWSLYRRCLAQRNAALRARWTKQDIAHWDHDLVAAAAQLDQARRSYLDALSGFVRASLTDFPAFASVDISYQQGWKEGMDYADYLSQQYESDRERGFTQFGPHRSDLRLKVDGHDARDYLSRGQQKVLVANLILAQCCQITSQDTSAVVLVDDLPAELDGETRERLIETLKATQAQVFLTSTDSRLFKFEASSDGVFHVEHGLLQP